jgi:colicin import membrane protein
MSKTLELEPSTALTVPSDNALTLVPTTAISVVLANDKDNLLGALAEKLAAFKGDASTEKGRKAITAMCSEIKRTKASLLRLADTVSEDARKTHAAIVAEKKVIEARFKEIEEQARTDLTEYEAQRKRREDHYENLIRHIIGCGHGFIGGAVSDIDACLEELNDVIVIDDSWVEFKNRAGAAKAEAIARLNLTIETKRKADAEAAELERLRSEEAERARLEAIRLQEEREAQIAAAAAQRAKDEAEAKAAQEAELQRQETLRREQEVAAAAELERQAAAKRERDAQAAIVAAKNAADRAEANRVAAEQRALQQAQEAAAQAQRDQAAAVAAERQRVADEAERTAKAAAVLAANKRHQQTINAAVLVALVLLVDEAKAKEIITAVARGKIPHMAINYSGNAA